MMLRYRLYLLAALALSSVSARAQQPAVKIETPAPPRALGIHGSCGPMDADCRRTILMAINRGHVRPITVGEGVAFAGKNGGSAIRFGVRAFEAERVSGEAGLILFDVAYLSEGGFRVRFTFADADALFTCENSENKAIPVGLSLFKECKAVEGGARAIIGVGGKLAQVQWDQITNRIIARWAELHGVINLLANANDKDYLQKRLQLYAGANIDTVWYGDSPGMSGGSNTLPKYHFGITGMLRPKSNHWEINGLAGFRQNLTDSSDFSFETRAQALYHVLYAPQRLMNIGIDAQYQYNSMPSRSMGELVSDREPHSAYLGAVLGFKFD